MTSTDVKLFAGSNSLYLAENVAKNYGQDLSKMKLLRFSDGEMQPEIEESVRGSYVFVIQNTNPPADNLMELLMIVDAAKRASANYITAVIPYFGYARQDRKDRPRVAIAAKLVANILTAAGVNRVMTMDLHAGQIQGFFDIPVDHLSSSAVFIPYIETLKLDNLCFASPDVGSVKRARTYAQYFNAEMVICDKYRKKANEVAEMTLIGNVEGKNVIITDDMIDTGGTLVNAADLILSKGAKSVRAMITHGVLSGNAYENIEKSNLTELVVSDSLPLKQSSPKIKQLSIAEVFATSIRNAHEHKSINSLFITPSF
ncbi:MAG TPA: ribose-phosphate pyrophosphokinase [Chitinophagales bacterium]